MVYLLDHKRNILTQKAAHGPKNPIEFDIKNPITLNFGEGICGAIALSGKGEIISDTTKDNRYKIDDSSRLSEIAIPIIIDNKIIGIIDSEHPEKGFYKDLDLEILTTIANVAGVKLSQIYAQEELKKHKEELEIKVLEQTLKLKKNIYKLKISHNELTDKITENETLLKEVHHRVKNNLQVVYSLLNLHSISTENEQEMTVFNDCKNRILTMSKVHQFLYSKGDLSKINIAEYIEEISKEVIKSYSSYRINLNFSLQSISLDIEQAIPFGLILNEILVNAVKHAFPMGEGIIEFELKVKENINYFSIRDNGIGFEPSSSKQSLGFELIHTLTDQLGGDLKLTSNDKGTSYEILF